MPDNQDKIFVKKLLFPTGLYSSGLNVLLIYNIYIYIYNSLINFWFSKLIKKKIKIPRN